LFDQPFFVLARRIAEVDVDGLELMLASGGFSSRLHHQRPDAAAGQAEKRTLVTICI